LLVCLYVRPNDPIVSPSARTVHEHYRFLHVATSACNQAYFRDFGHDEAKRLISLIFALSELKEQFRYSQKIDQTSTIFENHILEKTTMSGQMNRTSIEVSWHAVCAVGLDLLISKLRFLNFEHRYSYSYFAIACDWSVMWLRATRPKQMP
jgi:hypothetical protein